MKIIKRQVITLFLSFALAVTGLQTPFISPIDTHAAEARLNQAQTASIDLNRNGRNESRERRGSGSQGKDLYFRGTGE